MTAEKYDLEERLLEYAARIIRLAEHVTASPAGPHVALQVLRSGTSALPDHGGARAAESNRDFIHTLKLSLKELRETERWLKLIQRVPLVKKPALVEPLLQETDEAHSHFRQQHQNRPKELPMMRLLQRSMFAVQRSKFIRA